MTRLEGEMSVDERLAEIRRRDLYAGHAANRTAAERDRHYLLGLVEVLRSLNLCSLCPSCGRGGGCDCQVRR